MRRAIRFRMLCESQWRMARCETPKTVYCWRARCVQTHFGLDLSMLITRNADFFAVSHISPTAFATRNDPSKGTQNQGIGVQLSMSTVAGWQCSKKIKKKYGQLPGQPIPNATGRLRVPGVSEGFSLSPCKSGDHEHPGSPEIHVSLVQGLWRVSIWKKPLESPLCVCVSVSRKQVLLRG